MRMSLTVERDGGVCKRRQLTPPLCPPLRQWPRVPLARLRLAAPCRPRSHPAHQLRNDPKSISCRHVLVAPMFVQIRALQVRCRSILWRTQPSDFASMCPSCVRPKSGRLRPRAGSSVIGGWGRCRTRSCRFSGRTSLKGHDSRGAEGESTGRPRCCAPWCADAPCTWPRPLGTRKLAAIAWAAGAPVAAAMPRAPAIPWAAEIAWAAAIPWTVAVPRAVAIPAAIAFPRAPWRWWSNGL